MTDKSRKYCDDVFYEAWRRGVDPDWAADCAEDCYYDGWSPEECVDQMIARDRRKRERRREEELAQEELAQEEYERQRIDAARAGEDR